MIISTSYSLKAKLDLHIKTCQTSSWSSSDHHQVQLSHQRNKNITHDNIMQCEDDDGMRYLERRLNKIVVFACSCTPLTSPSSYCKKHHHNATNSKRYIIACTPPHSPQPKDIIKFHLKIKNNSKDMKNNSLEIQDVDMHTTKSGSDADIMFKPPLHTDIIDDDMMSDGSTTSPEDCPYDGDDDDTVIIGRKRKSVHDVSDGCCTKSSRQKRTEKK